MLELLPSPGPDVVAYRAGGTITERDIERAWAAMDAAIDESHRIGLYVEVVDLSGVTLAGLVKDLTLGLKNLGKLKYFRRVAVVTDAAWIRTAAGIEDKLFPSIEIRTFETAEDGAAMAWLTAHAAPAA
ncbi:MAG TPA: STAS/SEC14 domain-containing protein [Bacteroidetes bacterium]|nr:STAS/SEC14 domain-containing protein [Bacteroidota bacterium]HIL58775.1 STAS/SEC14 domain-containing protein [Rhodothermales bacterium]